MNKLQQKQQSIEWFKTHLKMLHDWLTDLSESANKTQDIQDLDELSMFSKHIIQLKQEYNFMSELKQHLFTMAKKLNFARGSDEYSMIEDINETWNIVT